MEESKRALDQVDRGGVVEKLGGQTIWCGVCGGPVQDPYLFACQRCWTSSPGTENCKKLNQMVERVTSVWKEPWK
jgi:hypothetical protein